ncbi:uncharacterized protein LOC144124143 [Amblyomma americanum]
MLSLAEPNLTLPVPCLVYGCTRRSRPAHSASAATTPCALQTLRGASTCCAQISVYSVRGRQRPLEAQHKSAGDLRQHQGPHPAAATRRGPCGSRGEGVLPRWFITADAEASRRWLNRRHQLLNRRLTATLKRMPSVFILNPDHRFLDAAKAPKKHLFAGDGYHLSAGEGVEELAEILVRSLEKVYGPGILASFSRVPTRHIIYACHHCGTKGHVNGDCYECCRP